MSTLNTIADVCRERLRRAGERLRQQRPDSGADVGFRAYRLESARPRPPAHDAELIRALLHGAGGKTRRGETIKLGAHNAAAIAAGSRVRCEVRQTVTGTLHIDATAFPLFGTPQQQHAFVRDALAHDERHGPDITPFEDRLCAAFARSLDGLLMGLYREQIEAETGRTLEQVVAELGANAPPLPGDVPEPGSLDAHALGCTCRPDVQPGTGAWLVSPGCPVHCAAAEAPRR